MKKILLVIFPSFAEFEITVATALLGSRYHIMTAAATLESLRSEAGLIYQPEITFSEVNPTDYEAIIIPGGDMVHLKDAEALFQIIQALHEHKKLIAAICSAAYVLNRAGLLADQPYTVTLNQEQRAFLGMPEDSFVFQDVVLNHHILTAQGHAFVEFGLQIASYFNFLTDSHKLFYKGEGNLLMEKK